MGRHWHACRAALMLRQILKALISSLNPEGLQALRAAAPLISTLNPAGLQDPAEHGVDGTRYQDTELEHPTATT